ncbi:MAG TPA: leucine--tRNA ligase [Candidatus Limnocylindrales bacterium]|jgi:leucyl-tRNA synthetase|nr:leucine--tRNA ligase [Candidatus Limnocylindrales bacterium]
MTAPTDRKKRPTRRKTGPKPAAPERTRIERYDPTAIEPRWQARWEELGQSRTDLADASRPRFYLLTMYPYPSGDIHIGHWYIKTPTDAVARFQRMQGKNVFLPIGFDAFGLPAENAAIARGIHPREWTMANIQNMRRQLRSMGASFDWDAEVITSDPDYYRWNQWLFLRFLEAGLAYRARSTVDWCPNDGTLAREQVEGADRHCWRCGAKVEKRDLEQWFLRVTKYADELLDFGGLDWPEPIKTMQTNWIGRSEGGEIVFTTAPDVHQPGGDELRVFTTRPDTLFGATFMVLAPEHPLVPKLTHPDRRAEVEAYVTAAGAETEIERLSTEREKTGVALGTEAINPVNGERIPIFVADYVLATYGTGAIMAVPAHDERDFAFATKFGLPIRRVVAAPGTESAPVDSAYEAHAADEVLVNSGEFSGLPANEGGRRIVQWLARDGRAKPAVTYRLRDWLISRQRYWGTPIPVIHCERCGIVPVPDEDLPVLLPDKVDYGGSGVNPLTRDESFVNVTCPRCGGPARRETDTMDTFIDSSWYWYRYLSPHYADGPFDPDMVETWTPVDQYTGGAEHAVMHLLYAREFTKMMRDVGVIAQNEPFQRLFNQGQILGEDGERMSKSHGNVQDPDELVTRYGADAIRLFLMFMGPWDQGGPWSPTGIGGVHRFLNRVWTIALDPGGTEPGDADSGKLPAGQDEAGARTALRHAAHRTLKVVTGEYTAFKFNTMVAHLIELANTLMRYRGTSVARMPEWDEAIRLLLLMLAPAAPHIAEELWSRRLAAAGAEWSSIHQERWPQVDDTAAAEETREVPVQVNGKLRDRVTVPAGISELELEQVVLARDKVQAALAGREPDRVIHAGGGRLVNVVAR